MQISRHWRMNSQRYRLEGHRVEGEPRFGMLPIKTIPQDQKLLALLEHIHENTEVDPQAKSEIIESTIFQELAGAAD